MSLHIADAKPYLWQTLSIAPLKNRDELQSWTYDSETGDLYIGQSVSESVLVHRYVYSEEGSYGYADTMTCSGSGHGSDIFCERVGATLRIGLTWDKDIVTIAYGAGTRSRSQAKTVNNFTSDYAVADLNGNYYAHRTTTGGDSDNEYFVMYDWPEMKAGRKKKYGETLGGWDKAADTFQGIGVGDDGETIWELTGKTNAKADQINKVAKPAILHEYNVKTGSHKKLDITDLPMIPGEPLRSYEPEGVGVIPGLGLCVMFKTGSGGIGASDERDLRIVVVVPDPKATDPEELTMAKCQNGYPVAFSRAAIQPSPESVKTANASFTVRSDHADAWQIFNDRFHAFVEAFDEGYKSVDEWSYNVRAIRGQTSGYSNHAGACAEDLNATQHPLATKPESNFTSKQISRMREMMSKFKGNGKKIFRWGGDYSGRKDPMHVEIIASSADVAAFVRDFRAGKISLSFEGPVEPVVYLPPYVVDPAKVSTFLWSRNAAGANVHQRKPGFVISTGVEISDGYLVTEAGYRYSMEYLILQSELPATPTEPSAPSEPEKPALPAVDEKTRASLKKIIWGLQNGSEDCGEDGEDFQAALNEFLGIELTIDGILGRNSRTAVAKAQLVVAKRNGAKLTSADCWPNKGYNKDLDGIVGAETFKAVGLENTD